MVSKLSSDGKALVDDTFVFKRLHKETAPYGQKVILANKAAGVATVSVLSKSDVDFFTHYRELPVFSEDEDDESQGPTGVLRPNEKAG